MQIVRQSSFKAMPWKNGGGVTHEVLRVPAAGETFDWRLSIAYIEAPGPFSHFPGYDRTMVLLRGCGVHLAFDAANPVSLIGVGDLARFDGALTTECRLVNGPCTDLNLMVARSVHGVVARVECIRERQLLPALAGRLTLVFGINTGLAVDCGGPAAHLAPWDLAVLPAGGGAVAPVPAASSSCLVFLATLDDNPR